MKSNLVDFLEEAAKVLPPEGTPEYEAALKKLANFIPKVQLDETYKNALAGRAQQFSPDGYKAYFELMHGRLPPEHVMEGEVKHIIESDIGTIVFAWRGSWKTVSITITFLSWFIGLFPEKTNLVVCASSDTAKEILLGVSEIVEYHPEFRRCFPHVIPDKDRWSLEGFNVIDTRMSREEWARNQAAVKDATLFGAGYDSHKLNGRHPSGLLICDDLHDEKNSDSEKLRREVISVVVKVILKTIIKDHEKLVTRVVFIGTPWADDDVNHYLKNTGEFKFISIPAAVRAKKDDEGAVYCDGKSRDGTVYEDIVGYWKFTFPDGYGVKSFISDRALLGPKTFNQMILLDLVAASSARRIYYSYPHVEIDAQWRGGAGLDPTNADETSDEKNSKMAIAVILRLPKGGGVVAGGVLKYASLQQTEDELLMIQSKYPNLQPTAVEDVGGGKVVFQALSRNPKIRIMKSGLKDFSDGVVRNKRERMNVMHKWFESGIIRISDEDTPFLNALRRLWEKFTDLDWKHSEEFDAGDAVFHALNNMPDLLQTPFMEDMSSPVRRRQESPFAGLGDYTWRK